jgi:hypothetical protein
MPCLPPPMILSACSGGRWMTAMRANAPRLSHRFLNYANVFMS